jgi:HlyD family secretion protein
MKFMLKGAALLLIASALGSCSGGDGGDIYTCVVEGTSVQVPAMTGGRIIGLYAETGEAVAAGQVLALIDTIDLSFQRAQLEAAVDEIGVQEEIALTARGRASSELEYLRLNHERLSNLLEGSAVTRQAVDDAGNRLRNAEAALATAGQQVRTVQAKKRQIEAQLALVDKQIADALVTAVTAGIVTNKYYEPGEAVPRMSPVYEIIDTREVWGKIYVGEEKLPSIKAGDEVRINIDGMAAPMAGRIEWISPKAEFTPKQVLTPESRTSLVYAVKIAIANPDGTLKHGMPVEVRL